jgi:N12 class adenine-specific DNA methylase/GGDEF domain-containing protein
VGLFDDVVPGQTAPRAPSLFDRSRRGYFDDVVPGTPGEAVAPTPEPSLFDQAKRYGGNLMGIVAAPTRGLGLLGTLTQEALAGTPAEQSRLQVDPLEGGFTGDLTGRSTRAPGLEDLSLEGLKAITASAAAPVIEATTGQKVPSLFDISRASGLADDPLRGTRGEESLRAGAEGAARFGIGLATDPLTAGFAVANRAMTAAGKALPGITGSADDIGRALGRAVDAGQDVSGYAKAADNLRRAQILDRATGAVALPGMAGGVVDSGGQYLEQGAKHGYFSPEAIEPGVQALLGAAGVAGVGADFRERLHPGAVDPIFERPVAEVIPGPPRLGPGGTPSGTPPRPVPGPQGGGWYGPGNMPSLLGPGGQPGPVIDIQAMQQTAQNISTLYGPAAAQQAMAPTMAALMPPPQAPPALPPGAPQAGLLGGELPPPDPNLLMGGRTPRALPPGPTQEALAPEPVPEELASQEEGQPVIIPDAPPNYSELSNSSSPVSEPGYGPGRAPAVDDGADPYSDQMAGIRGRMEALQAQRAAPAAEPEPVVDEPAPTVHKFSSTQVDLPPAEAARVLDAGQRLIPDEVLGGDGRETKPHVTVQYGIESVDPEPVRAALAGEGPIKVRLGKVSTFPPSNGSDGMDVVKVDVDSPDLARLRKKIADTVGAPGDTHADYVPHVTLAYVQPGQGKRFAGDSSLEGQEITLSSLTFSGKDGNVVEIPLTGRAGDRRTPPPQPVDVERRTGDRRARIAEELGLPPESPAVERVARAEERAEEAEKNHLSGLPGRAAFERAKATHKGPWASGDVGGLGFVNDFMGGHPTGDAFLRTMGDAVREVAAEFPDVQVFHYGGDEIALAGPSYERLRQAAEAIRSRVMDAEFTGQRNGRDVTFKGVRFDFGFGDDFATADKVDLPKEKDAAVQAGLRRPKEQKGLDVAPPTFRFGEEPASPGQSALQPASDAGAEGLRGEPGPRDAPGDAPAPQEPAAEVEEALDVRATEPVDGPAQDDQGALDGTPAEDDGEAPGSREAGRSGGRRVQPDGERVPRPDEQGPDGGPGVGDGQGDVGAGPGRGGQPESLVRPDDAEGSGDGDPGRVTAAEAAPESRGTDYAITDSDRVGEGTVTQKYADNLSAIKLLKKIEAEGRLATAEEQAVLVRYVGWGGMPQAFDRYGRDAAWGKRSEELAAILTDEELRAARASTPNAHYTSPMVVVSMWSALEHMGLRPGARMLEPSVGVGHFFGLMPAHLAAGAKRTGVELDSITGRIAKLLYPNANIHVKGFEAVPLPDGFFDVTASNVPFGNYGIHDPAYKKAPAAITRSIHDYFFAKGLDKVRVGGMVAFITTHHTLDKVDSTVRDYLAERADLVGAIRLPNTAFKGNAGTEVTTDIIFLRKRAPGTAAEGESWKAITEIAGKDGAKVPVNEYFARHPEMMLGQMALEGSMYRADEPTLVGKLTPELLAEAVARLPKDAIKPADAKVRTRQDEQRLERLQIDGEDADRLKEGAFTTRDGKLYVREGTELKPVTLPAKTAERVMGMTELRDTLRGLLRRQLVDASDADLAKARKLLNQKYDAFVKKHGPLHARPNLSAFQDDPDAPLLLSLENWDDDAKKATKADVFSTRTVHRQQPVQSAGTAAEALTVSLNESGRLDWDRMRALTGKTEAALQKELGSLVYEDPEGGAWDTADTYLAGDVRHKLRMAEAAAKADPKFRRNVDALQKVQPKDLEPGEIDARLGSTWIPTTDVRDFLEEVVGLRDVNVSHAAEIGTWTVDVKGGWSLSGVGNTETWGTQRYGADELVSDALNMRTPTVHDIVDDKRVVNQAETTAAREKQDKLKTKFREWVWADPERADRLAEKYNRESNNIRLWEPDGSHLTFPGMAKATLRGNDLAVHQKNAVWRVVRGNGNTLIAHVVGAGKTFEMIAAGMEMRRLGIARKPIYVVPNHLVAQWGADFLRLYPNANVLVAGKEHFAKGKRERILSRIATGNYDAVIVSHRSFEALPVSDETFNSFLQEQIDALERVIRQTREEESQGYGRKRADSRIVKQLEKAKKALESKIRKKADRDTKDRAVTFEELGVDAMFVDEAHAFKKLFFGTKMGRVPGASGGTPSKRAFDMYIKSQYLTRLNSGKGVVFATGTPITNSMAEMFTMQRFLQEGWLQQNNVAHFDGWAGNFGETVTGIELAPDGSGYRSHTRFAKFVNLPELMTAFRQVADVQTAEMLNLPRPKIKGGKPGVAAAPGSPLLKAFVQTLVARAARLRSGGVDPKEDNMLNVTNDGRKAALDMRLVDPTAPDDPDSKANIAVRRILDIYRAGAKRRTTQLVFLDLSTPADKKDAGQKFSVYDDMRDKLVKAGVPAKEIAFIHSADTDEKKAALFNSVNAGRVRILLGSTEKMGAGMNVQKRLVALHHIDAPWRPADIEQREGRILRQGNDNEEVEIHRYVTEGSFDAYMWQTLETKSRFISQVMRGDSSVRHAEDVDGGPLTYAEVKAIASGNPEVLEKVRIDSEIRKLDTLRTHHTNAVARMRRELLSFPDRLAGQKRVIAATEADIVTRDKAKGDEFSIELFGKKYDDKDAANAAIQEKLGRLTKEPYATEPEKIGSFLGLTVEVRGFGNGNTALLLTGKGTRSAPSGTVGSLEYAAKNLEGELKNYRAALAGLEKKLADMKAEAERPFEHEAKLAELVKKQEALNSRLDLDKSDQQAGQEEDAGDEVDEGGDGGEPPTPKAGGLSGAADDARKRLRARTNQSKPNSEVTAMWDSALNLKDAAIIGADYMSKGLKRLGAWSKAMVREFGNGIRSVLRRVFADASNVFRAAQRATAKAAAGTPPPVVPKDTKPTEPAKRRNLDEGLGKETAAERLERYWVDANNRVKQMVAAVRDAGGKVTDETDIGARKKLFDAQTNHDLEEARQKFEAPLRDVLRKYRILPDELKAYLLARHAPAANRVAAKRVGAKSAYGMTDADAAKHLAALDPARRAQLEEAASIVRKITAEQRRVMRDSGLVSAQEIGQWEARFGPDYVPVKTFDDDPLLAFIASGDDLGRNDVLGHESKMRLAQDEMPDDPVAFALHGLERTIVRANKNRLAQDLAKLIKDNPSKFWGIDREHRKPAGETSTGAVKWERDHIADLKDLHYKVAGVTHRISVDDPVLMAQLKGNDKQTGEFLRTAAKFTRAWSALVTKLSPEFILTNPLRDIQQVIASAGVEHGKDAVKRISGNVRHAIRAMYNLNVAKGDPEWKKYAREFMEDGGVPEAYVVRDPKKISAELRSHVEAGTWKRSAKAAAEWVERANRAMEGGIRLAVYRAMREMGKSRQQAAVIARQMSVDFAQKGEAGPAINALYAFFNANIQGSRRLYEVLNSKRGAALGATLVSAGVAVDLLNRAVAGDDDEDGRNDYDQIPEYVKERNLIIPTGGKPLMVPLPWGYNVVFNTGRLLSASAHGAMDPKDAAGYLSAGLLGAFNPLGSEEELEQILSPTLLDPVVQLSTNKTFSGKPIAPENRFGQQKPDSSLYFRNASEGSKKVARALNSAFGGDDITSSGWTDISPNSIDHVMSWAFGGAGRFLGQGVDIAGKAAKGEAPTVRDVPGLRRVVYTPSPGEQSGRYVENAQLLDKEYARFEHYRKNRDMAGMRSVPKPLLSAKRAFDRYDSEIRRLNKLSRERGVNVDEKVRRLQIKANKLVEAARRAPGAN